MSDADMKIVGIAAATCAAVIILNQFWKNRGGAGLESYAPTAAA